MSNNQNDHDFPAINIDMDEHRPIAAKSSNKNTMDSDETPSIKTKQSGSNALAIFCLLLAIGACGASYYLYQQLQQTISEANRTEQRLLSLEDKLSATGEEIGNSTVALQVKVTELSATSKELWEQMDKLWASAWRRNQQEIKALDNELAGVKNDTQTKITAAQKATKDAVENTQQMLSRIDGLNAKLNNQANDILSASVSAEQAMSNANGQSGKITTLNEKILLLEKRNTSLLNRIDDLETQLRELATKTVSNRQVNTQNSLINRELDAE